MNASGITVVAVNVIGLAFAVMHTVIVGTENEPSLSPESSNMILPRLVHAERGDLCNGHSSLHLDRLLWDQGGDLKDI